MEGRGRNNGADGSNIGRSTGASTLVVAYVVVARGPEVASTAQGQGVAASVSGISGFTMEHIQCLLSLIDPSKPGELALATIGLLDEVQIITTKYDRVVLGLGLDGVYYYQLVTLQVALKMNGGVISFGTGQVNTLPPPNIEHVDDFKEKSDFISSWDDDFGVIEERRSAEETSDEDAGHKSKREHEVGQATSSATDESG
ncbi:hypothetical protein ACLOJK_012418 [Asimina triloba]